MLVECLEEDCYLYALQQHKKIVVRNLSKIIQSTLKELDLKYEIMCKRENVLTL